MEDTSKWNGDDFNEKKSSLLHDLELRSCVDSFHIDTKSTSSSSNIDKLSTNRLNSLSLTKQSKRNIRRITDPHRNIEFSYKAESIVEKLDRSLSPKPRRDRKSVSSKPGSSTTLRNSFNSSNCNVEYKTKRKLSNSSSLVRCIKIIEC